MEKIIDLIYAYGMFGLGLFLVIGVPFTIYCIKQIVKANQEMDERRKKHLHFH